MVSIPVRLYKAARRERIRFHHVYRPVEQAPEPDLMDEIPPPPVGKSKIHELPKPPSDADVPTDAVARVRNQFVGEVEETPVERAQVLKGYEIEKDRFVTFEPRELAAVRPKTSTELGIAEFVRLEEIDPIFFDTSFYAAPERGSEKPYALLFAALAQSGYAAIGSLAMHGREHATVIRPGRRGLIIHTLYYEKEVRAGEEYAADTSLVNAKELELAKTVVGALAAAFDASKLKDAFEERLRALIESRAETAVAAYGREAGEEARPAPVLDIMEALRKSLEMARKPPKTETARPPAKSKAAKSKRSRS